MDRIWSRFTAWFPWFVRLLLEWTLVRKARNPDPEVLRRYRKGQMESIRAQEKKKMEDLLVNNLDAMEVMTENIRQHFRPGADDFCS